MMRRENERFSFKRKYSYKDKVRRITKQRVTNACLYRPIPTSYPIFFFSIKSLLENGHAHLIQPLFIK